MISRVEATPAGPLRRIGAATIDWAICAVAYLTLAIPLGALEGFGFVLRTEDATTTLGRFLTTGAQIGLVAPVLVYFTLGLREGHTLGMAAFDFKTLDVHTGNPPGTVRSAMRALLSAVLAVAVYAAYMGHSAEPGTLSSGVRTMYVVCLAITALVALDKALVPIRRSGRSLTDRIFGLVRASGAASGDDRGLSIWLDERTRS